jgi:hypothetical protein
LWRSQVPCSQVSIRQVILASYIPRHVDQVHNRTKYRLLNKKNFTLNREPNCRDRKVCQGRKPRSSHGPAATATRDSKHSLSFPDGYLASLFTLDIAIILIRPSKALEPGL